MEETTGQYLKRIRENKGISLEEAAEETKIRLSYLKALEEDNLENLPGSAYARGFLHNYAQFLGIEELKEQYQQEQLLANLLSEEEKSGKIGKKKGILLASGVLLVFVVPIFLYYSLKGPSPEAIRHIPLKEQEKQISGNVPLTSTLSPKEHKEDLVLFTSATEKVWMRVVVDKKDTFTFFLYPSDNKTFRAKEEIKVRIGNAGGLHLKLNDKDLGSLGKSGQVINRIFRRKDLLPNQEIR